nr:Abi family protein [Corynebacterium sp. sy017]
MIIADPEYAVHVLRTHSYYRLSGYWYPMRSMDPITRCSLDTFREGANFDLVLKLYDFDARLHQL